MVKIFAYIPTKRGPMCKEIDPNEQYKKRWEKVPDGLIKEHIKIICGNTQVHLGTFCITGDLLTFNEHVVTSSPADIKNKKNWLMAYAQYLIDEPDELIYHLARSEFTLPAYVSPVNIPVFTEEMIPA